MWKYILISVIIVAIIVTVVVLRKKQKYTDTAPNQLSLNTSSILMNSDDSFTQIINSSGSTILGLFNFQFANRTQTLNNNYIPIFGVNPVWNLEILRHPTKTDTTTARIRVNTVSKDGINSEFITLPDIPLQKWIMIGILRDGRRFDVIYNNDIVASHRIENYPFTMPSPLVVGNTNIVGNTVHVIVYPERLNSIHVNQIYKSLVDTNGSPKQSIKEILFPGNISLPSLSSFPNLSGVFNVPQTPSNNLQAWSTPYA